MHQSIMRLNNLQIYSEININIKKKSGELSNLIFNKAQLYIHEKLEEQKKKIGRVRAVILKGRQQGCSTYVCARFYHRTVMNKGIYTFIFAHDAAASRTLFDNVNMIYNMSHEELKPYLGTSNAKELLFTKINSGYKVGTAGSKGLGRSKTFQQVHWSEVAYSPNCSEHAAGILQTVSDDIGTEIILESTANGQGDYFYRMCMQAISGESDYILIFVPWYWQDEYKRKIDNEFLITEEENNYLNLYKKDGLTLEHLNWRRNKIIEFERDTYRFKREYPFSVEEAFQTSDEKSYINHDLIIKAYSGSMVLNQEMKPLILGVDPAHLGKDRIVICFRRGRNVEEIRKLPSMDCVKLSSAIASIINEKNIDYVFIDIGGLGIGIYDFLCANGFSRVVRKVNFGSSADDKERYFNKRCEMYGRAKLWLQDDPCFITSSDPDALHALQSQITNIKVDERNIKQSLKLESKIEIKSRCLPSPDFADAFVLTFAEIINPSLNHKNIKPVQFKKWSGFNA